MFALGLAGYSAAVINHVIVHREGIRGSAEAECTNPNTDCPVNDLEAQVRAASAAEATVDLSIIHLVFAVLTAGGLGATVFYAHRTWEAAKADTVLQLRPWMMFDTIEFDQRGAGGPVDLQVVWRNFGRTPAICSELLINHKVLAASEEPGDLRMDTDDVAITANVPPDRTVWPENITVSFAELKNCRTHIKSRLTYTDTISSDPHVTLIEVVVWAVMEEVGEPRKNHLRAALRWQVIGEGICT